MTQDDGGIPSRCRGEGGIASGGGGEGDMGTSSGCNESPVSGRSPDTPSATVAIIQRIPSTFPVWIVLSFLFHSHPKFRTQNGVVLPVKSITFETSVA